MSIWAMIGTTHVLPAQKPCHARSNGAWLIRVPTPSPFPLRTTPDQRRPGGRSRPAGLRGTSCPRPAYGPGTPRKYYVGMRGFLAMLVASALLSACGAGSRREASLSGSGRPSATIVLPDCNRQGDHTTVGQDGCLLETALTLGYDGVAANSFHLAYRICYDTDLADLVQQYGGGSHHPSVIARTFSNRLFNNDESERAGFDGCTLALRDRGASKSAVWPRTKGPRVPTWRACVRA
jgi:hypothetical protein